MVFSPRVVHQSSRYKQHVLAYLIKYPEHDARLLQKTFCKEDIQSLQASYLACQLLN